MSKPEILIRDCTESDIPFVMNSYLKSYREAPMNRMLTDHAYYQEHVPTTQMLMMCPESRVRIAVDPEHTDQIFGYMWSFQCPEKTYVHWMYVKLPFRRFGIANLLLADLPADVKNYYTHFNENYQFFRKHKAEYMPWYYFIKETSK